MGRVVRVRVGVFFTEPPARMRTRCAALELFAYRATIRAKPERPAHLSFKICVRPSFLKTICWLLAAFKNDAINLLQKALVNQIRKLVQKYLLPYESKATRCSARALMGGFCSRSCCIRQNSNSLIPIFQTSACSSLRSRLHRRSVSSYQYWRFCAT